MRYRVFALALGIICHVSFLLAISAMAYMLFFGLSRGLWPIGGQRGRFANIILLLQFPLLHSALLTRGGRKVLSALAPKSIGSDLVTTTFAFISSLQLLLVFLFWTPSNDIWLEPLGIWYYFMATLYGFSWLLLMKSLYDAGLSLHSGWLGWAAVLQGNKPRYASFPRQGLFRICRQPIYLSFALILWTAPVWTLDRFLVTLIWSGYCFFAPVLKERRFLQFYGNEFAEYQKRVPYMIPLSTFFNENLLK